MVVYLLLAGCLFVELGHRQVWHKLTVGLGALPVARPGDNALWRARARLGPAPLRWLFDLLRGPDDRMRDLRIAITDAIEAAGGTDRGSFTIALNAARDLLTQAANVIAGTIIDLTGDIGRRVLASLLPDRRLRVSPRIVKRAISKWQARGPTIDRRSYKATLSINILTAPGP